MIKSLFKYTVALSLFITSTVSLAQVALEEMVVTSQKREQNLLDVPSALQAFSGDMLEDAGVRDTNDLTGLVPDMMMSGEEAGRANIWLRGIGSTAFDPGSESSNALFVDEIYMSRAQSVMTGLVDLERIEVLKGPQGTLYGRNALGGAISIFYKKPTSEFEQKLKAGIGDSGYQSLSYMVSGELANNLYGRMIIGYQDIEGAHKETSRGEDDGPENQNFRFSLFGEGDNHEWSLTADYGSSDIDELVSEAVICEDAVTVCNSAQYNLIKAAPGIAARGIDIFQTNLAGAAAYATDAAGIASLRADKYSAASDIDTFSRNEDTLISGKVKFFRDDYDLTIIAATNQNQGEELRDFDATLNFNKSQDAGLTFVKYYGDVIPTTRDHCRNIINGVYNKRKSGLFTVDEVNALWTSRSWKGKKSGNPLIVRGGYNCRHQWSYVNPDWYDSKGELII